jgi:hypothetical protein
VATHNDITGDSIQSRKPTKAYEDNYDAIFRKDKVEEPSVTTNKPLESTKAEHPPHHACPCQQCEDYFEKRIDSIGQNGNDGDHYSTT